MFTWTFYTKTLNGYRIWKGISEKRGVAWQATKDNTPPPPTSGGYGALEGLLRLLNGRVP